MAQVSIQIQALKIVASIGVWARERTTPQPIEIDITAWLNAAPQHDKLEETASYDDIAKAAQMVADRRHHDLIETLAVDICKEVVAMGPVESAEVRVTKIPQTVNAEALTATAKL